MGPIVGRNHSQVYPHMRAKFGHDRSSSLAAYTRQTHRQNLYYIDIDNLCVFVARFDRRIFLLFVKIGFVVGARTVNVTAGH